MEILIPGILLVALMVYVSTRIKRKAAAAYEAETIENAGFYIFKPAGLLYPLRGGSEFAFEAYSNDYGDGNLRSVWQMQATLRIYTDREFDAVRGDIKTGSDAVLSEEVARDAPAGQRICLIESEKTVDGVKTRDFWKIVESFEQKKIYELKVSVLEESLDHKIEKAAAMIESLAVKSGR